MIFNKTSLIAGLVGAFAVSSAAQAGGVPKKTAWTAYGTTSSGYAWQLSATCSRNIMVQICVLYLAKMISLAWHH